MHRLHEGEHVEAARSVALFALDVEVLARQVTPGTSLTAAEREFRRALGI